MNTLRHALVLPALAALLLPLSSFADTVTTNGVTWTYSVSNGKATISNGYSAAIPDSTSGDLNIPSSLGGYPVESIGDYAFRSCSGLTSITIPDSVTSIGGKAFYGCSGLTSVTIPDGVTSIGNNAFIGCSGLAEVHISDLAAWSGIAFADACANPCVYAHHLFLNGEEITDLIIPDSVTSIGDHAFYCCSGLTSVTIPDGVTRIGENAFHGCSGLTSITIPDGVTIIADDAFSGCSGLMSVTISDSVTSIARFAFQGCYGQAEVTADPKWGRYFSSATNLSFTIPGGVTCIGENAFSGCSGLTSITIPDSVTSIGDSAFSGCSGLTSITIPNSVTSIGGSAFSGCSGLTSITIPDSVTSIGNSAFSGCSGLTSITIPGSVTSIGGTAFSGCSGLTSVTIPDSVTNIGGSAFSGCSGLTSITIPKSVTSIVDSAFSGCSGLTLVTIPDSVTSIGNSAFSGCSGLTSITIPGSVTSIGGTAFSGCSGLTSVTIPDGVTSIGDSAFSGCSGLMSITIPNSVTSIGHEAFRGCSGLTSITLPDSVASIGEEAFWDCSGLTSITIPNNVTSLGDCAFQDCSGLTSITIPDSVTSIGVGAFYGCSGLTNAVIGNSVMSIGNSAFWGCSGLTSITIPDSVTSIGSAAFNGCSAVRDVVLPGRFRMATVLPSCFGSVTNVVVAEGSTNIENHAFSDCSGLTSITIPDGVTEIGDAAFLNCSGLTSIPIPDGVTSIGNNAFSGCSGLTSITIPDSVTSIEEEVFYRCSGLTAITIPDSVTNIGWYAFYHCSGLTSIMIPDSVTSIGDCAFSGCSGLTDIWLPPTFIGNTGNLSVPSGCSIHFYDCSVFFNPTGGQVSPTRKSISANARYGTLPTPVRSGYVFLDWRLDGAAVDAATIVQTAEDHTLSARWGVAVGNGVWEEMIGDEPIVLGAPEIAPTGAVDIPSEIASRPVVAIGVDAFAGNTAITSITIPASVTNIADGAFAGCTGLKTVSISHVEAGKHLSDFVPGAEAYMEEVVFLDGVTAIPDNFFEGCTALETMDVAESVIEIGTNVFEACSALETVVSNGLEICDGWVLGMANGAAAPADLAIPDSVRGIAAFAFDGEGGIGTLALPESLRFIGAGAFRNCTGLEGIAVPEGVWKIDREAFRNCTYAQGLALGEGIVELGDGAFANCSMLMGAEVPAGVEKIGENCFSNCWRMLSVSIPQSVERIGAGAFADCRRLAGATVPLHVAPMSELFPAAYASLETISISRLDLEALEHLEGLESENAIQAYIASRQMVPEVFKGCAALEGIELPPWVCNVADGAFEGCAAMDEIAFPDAVTNIGARACASMAALEAVAFPAGLVAIGEGALSNCAAVASLALPDGLRTIGARAFDGLALLARADVPGSVRAIGDGAFAGCAAIRAVAMPGDAGTVAAVFPDCYADIVSATVVAETDGAGAPLPVVMDGLFEGCAALTRVELPQDLAEIGAGAFADCAALTEIGIPAAVTNIGAAAFAGCGTLSSIALPKSLEVVQDRTFQGCASMAEIIVPESVRALGTAVFDGCTLLRSVRFVGNAPDYATADGGPYAGVPAGAKSYVANGSMGWDGIPTSRALPEYWPAGTTYEIDFWTPNRCAVSFDANYEGAGEPAEVEQVTGTSYVLPADPVRPGARFGGWWTAPENGARITASTQVTATRPHTFYAQWTMNRYFVHFDASGGSGTADPVEMTVGTPAALPACPFAKVAHDFAGWATEPGGEAVYADGAEVVDLAYAQNAAVTLYAVWRSRDWTLADYLDAPTLDFETSGGGAWGPDWQDAKAGGVSLRCDGLPPAAEGGTVEAALRTTVTGAGTLAFWWKVSCEENDEQYDDWFDYATFAIDGAEVSRIAGDSGWVRVESAVTGAGEHGLVWTFTRDDYDEDGADWENALWVDGIEWTPAPVTLTFAGGGAAEGSPPAAVVKYEGYALALPGPGTLADPPRVFAGWTDGESVYAAGATYVFGSADAVLTAVWTLQTWTLAEAVDAPALVFATGGDADWAVDATAGWTNGVSAKSGSVTNSQASWIETTVSGAGTLAFRWKVLGGIYRNNPFAYAKVETNGAVAAQTHLTDGWEEQTVEVSGAGTHTIRWTYLRTSARTADGDCAWLDGVAWTPAGAASVVVEGVEIPIAWLDEAAASIVAASGGDYAAAAEAPAANGVNEVWECYVAGLDPTNAASRLLATIDMVDGEPAVRWTPDLNEGGTKHERDYVVEGKTNLVDRSWGPTNEATRFFRVRVGMP